MNCYKKSVTELTLEQLVDIIASSGDKLKASQPPVDQEVRNKSKAWGVVNFLSLAYDDYVAARALFLNNMLPQGCALAATSVEKYLKALIAIRGNSCHGHLSKRLFKNVENYQPNLWEDLNSDYLEFLAKAYELRYLDNKETGFGIVINKYRCLAELDRTIALIDKGFELKVGTKPFKTRFQTESQAKSEALCKENGLLLGIPKDVYFRKENHVLEMWVGLDGKIWTLKYVTKYVQDIGSFMKQPQVSLTATGLRGQVTGG